MAGLKSRIAKMFPVRILHCTSGSINCILVHQSRSVWRIARYLDPLTSIRIGNELIKKIQRGIHAGEFESVRLMVDGKTDPLTKKSESVANMHVTSRSVKTSLGNLKCIDNSSAWSWRGHIDRLRKGWR